MSTSEAAWGAAALLLFLGAGCRPEAPPAPPPPPPADYLPRAAAAPEKPPPVVYRDVTRESGVRFVHENGSFGKKFLPETMGSGVVIFDYDGDGLQDLFLVNGMRWPGHQADYRDQRPPATQALYRNLGGMRFEDVSARAGVQVSFMGMGGAAADVDGDGDQDLFVTGVGKNLFFRNDGGRFTECAAEVGLSAPTWTDKKGKKQGSWGTGAVFLDYDRDGRIDLFVANYVRWSEETDIFNTLDGTSKAFTTPDFYDGDSCRLYRNLEGRFQDVTEEAGILHPNGKSLGVAVEDVDGDGWPDLLVSNDTQPNFLFHNRSNGSFEEIALVAGIAYSPDGRARAGMGIDAFHELNGDGLTIAIGNFSKEPMSLYREEKEKRGFYRDDSAPARLGPATNPFLTFGLLFLDYDLDGLPDLCLVNGHIEPSIQEVQKEITYAQPPQLFRNQGDGRYAELKGAAGEFFTRSLVGRGLAAGDLDGDGDLDLVLTQNGGPAAVLRCDSQVPNRSLRLRLRSSGPNRDALGAQVWVTAGGTTQRRCVRTGSSYLSQSELTLTFGLGTRPSAEKVEVLWPDGKRESWKEIAAGASYLVEQGRAHLKPDGPRLKPDGQASKIEPRKE
jgi:hypothetical protein